MGDPLADGSELVLVCPAETNHGQSLARGDDDVLAEMALSGEYRGRRAGAASWEKMKFERGNCIAARLDLVCRLPSQ